MDGGRAIVPLHFRTFEENRDLDAPWVTVERKRLVKLQQSLGKGHEQRNILAQIRAPDDFSLGRQNETRFLIQGGTTLDALLRMVQAAVPHTRSLIFRPMLFCSCSKRLASILRAQSLFSCHSPAPIATPKVGKANKQPVSELSVSPIKSPWSVIHITSRQ